MALMMRVTVKWSGGQIGSGFTNLFFTDGVSTAQLAADSVRTFFSDVLSAGAHLPAGVTVSYPSNVDRIEPLTGLLINTVPITQPAALVGSGAGNYSAPSGFVVGWLTGDIVTGHRVIGRTFFVPLAQSAYESNGTLGVTFLSTAVTAANAFIGAAPEFIVWHRPASVAAANGSPHVVLAAKINDKAAMLTSRR